MGQKSQSATVLEFWNFAGGIPEWLNGIGHDRHDLTAYDEPVPEDVGTENYTHTLHLPQTAFLRMWKSVGKAKPES